MPDRRKSYEARMRSLGLAKLTVWVAAADLDRFKALAEQSRDAAKSANSAD